MIDAGSIPHSLPREITSNDERDDIRRLLRTGSFLLRDGLNAEMQVGSDASCLEHGTKLYHCLQDTHCAPGADRRETHRKLS